MAIAQAELAANQPEFEIELGPHAPGELRVLSFEADERLSTPFELTVTLAIPPDVTLDADGLIGEHANVFAQLGDGQARFFDGIVAKVRTWIAGRETSEQRARVTLVPKLWKLGKVVQSRIFQDKNVPEIVQEVLDEAGVELRLALSAEYAPRTFCVQYRESDLDFVQRLLEDEGIYYFFEHEQGTHTLVLADATSAYVDLPGDPKVVFREPDQMAASGEFVDAFASTCELRPGKVTLRDFDETRPNQDLTQEAEADASTELEVYDYPGGYQKEKVGKALSKVRLEAERVRAATFHGTSICRRLAPGFAFTLDEHPIADMNGDYVVVSVTHRGQQFDQVSAIGAPPEPGRAREGSYRNDFVALKKDVPFRPERRTPRPLIGGAQTALVVGPSGEEIHTDDLGRIKVLFHWDREGPRADKSSCWVRVAQSWAGAGWGALYLPRIGQEVVVEFLEGDPDRPLVTGSVYNGANPPPVSLPGDKTKSTLKSASSPGSNGANELRFEDAAGQEEIYLHAQRDLNITIENDKTQHVGGNETLTVDKDRTRSVSGHHVMDIKQDDTTTVGGNQTISVGAARTATISGADTESVGADQAISVGGARNVMVGAAASESVGAGKMLNVGAAYAVNVGGTMNELVGGAKSEEIGGAKAEVVKGKKTEMVMGAKSLTVKGDVSEKNEKGRTLKVEKNYVVNVKGKHETKVTKSYKLKAKEIVIAAEDQFTLKVGSATLQVKKNGDVVLKGGKIQVKANGDLVMKASKISEA